jgi:hypothetical protein
MEILLLIVVILLGTAIIAVNIYCYMTDSHLKYENEYRKYFEKKINKSRQNKTYSEYEDLDKILTSRIADMRKVEKFLFFSGICGEKWLYNDELKNEFKSMLARVQENGGKVVFYLLNPQSTYYEKFRKSKTDFPASPYPFFYECTVKYKCFEVDLYDRYPSIRILKIDQSEPVIRRYVLEFQNDLLKRMYQKQIAVISKPIQQKQLRELYLFIKVAVKNQLCFIYRSFVHTDKLTTNIIEHMLLRKI